MAELKVGVAQVDYTPRLGLPLMGNYRDDYGARGVHDPLYARALVVQGEDGTKVAMLSVDICELDRNNVAFMRQVIASQTDLVPENILVAATHTHSAPAPLALGTLPKADDADVEAFLSKASNAAVLANHALKPAHLKFGLTQEERLSFVRRLKCKDGKTHMNWEGLEPEFVVEVLGRIDPEVSTLWVAQENRPVATLVNFGLHPAVLAGDNWLYSADYPGYLAEAMARLLGRDFITVFFNGCCANVNHIDYRDKLQGRGYQMTQRIGYMMAVDAYHAGRQAESVGGSEVAISHEKVSLQRLKISEEQRRWSEEVVRRTKESPSAGQVDGLPEDFYAATWLRMYELQHHPDAVEVMVMRIGDVGIVGMPGEIFAELGLEIKRCSPAKHTMVTELANDAIGYIPNREAFSHGGYEPTPGSTFYEPGAGEALVASAVRQLNQLFG